MDTMVKELVDYTQNKWKLENYYLYSYHFYRQVSMLNETVYILSMEWYPSHITDIADEDSNPEGTAVIEIDVSSRQFKSVIFVGDISFVNGIVIHDQNDIIKWVEKEMALKYREQFILQHEAEREFHFGGCIHGVTVFPPASIRVNFNKENKLTLFSNFGHFPSTETVLEEKFSLTVNELEEHTKNQLKLVEIPSRKHKMFMPVYCIEELYVTNDRPHVIPFYDVSSQIKIDNVMHWDTSIRKSFKRKPLDLSDEITLEQVFSLVPHPDLFPITSTEIERCINVVKDFLSNVYHNDSGKWILKTLHRENGYFVANLKETDKVERVSIRKLRLFIDTKTIKVCNYMDNKDFMEMYEGFKESAAITINKDTAYAAIKSKLELKPVYVYDFEQNKYLLCGEINSKFGVNAINGELTNLNDL
ncbi:hypothetical protein [Alkalihalobacillus deserti]|uniref:hypothetical protein n=1 Tax=Alkalihalobacillus deserti TaxID=2879466 RepID=UPI001D147E4E|nr:hypothetical protein [Alkalihalobacillus deserti]